MKILTPVAVNSIPLISPRRRVEASREDYDRNRGNGIPRELLFEMCIYVCAKYMHFWDE